MAKLTKKQEAALRDLHRKLSMGQHTVSFGMDKVTVHGKEVDVTDFIIERTELWRKTWILPVLSELLGE